jgi:integrase
MAPRIRSYSLENRTQRLRLPVRRKSYSVQIAVRPAIRLGYRRNLAGGTWSAMTEGWIKGFATADDFEESNGSTILTYHEAVDRARQLARGSGEVNSDGRPVTVAEALDRYETDLQARSGCLKNATRVRANLNGGLAAKSVSLLGARELRSWRDGLLSTMTASSVNRTCQAIKACLNLAADLDGRIKNRGEWKRGLAAIPDAAESRNVILADDVVRTIVARAYEVDFRFGLLVEVLANTGARISQARRLVVGELLSDRLMMPPSRKGGKKKRAERRPVPISASLVRKLQVEAGGRRGDELLFAQAPSDHRWQFVRTVKAAGLDPEDVTIYALRHSSIVRQIIANVPIRVVASNHDTSVTHIEKTYSRYITDHTDALTRAALLDSDTAQ